MKIWLKLIIVAALATIIVVAGTLVYLNYFTRRRVFISTTTSLYDTGVLNEIEKDYEETHNVDLNILAVGTGVAIQHAQNGGADIVLVHSPSVEKTFLEGGYGLNRKIIAYNFFTIAGPQDDPAGIAGKNATEAMKRIYAYGEGLADTTAQIYISRGVNSGTDSKEQSLWKAVGYNYTTDISTKSWYATTGQGMGATLTVADQKGAYVLSDIGTYLKFYTDGTIELPALITEEQLLLNVYSAMAVNPATVAANQSVHTQISFSDAMEFIEYLVSDKTQALITNYGNATYEQSLFTGAVHPLETNSPQPVVNWIKAYAFFNSSECPPQYRNGYEHLFS